MSVQVLIGWFFISALSHMLSIFVNLLNHIYVQILCIDNCQLPVPKTRRCAPRALYHAETTNPGFSITDLLVLASVYSPDGPVKKVLDPEGAP